MSITLLPVADRRIDGKSPLVAFCFRAACAPVLATLLAAGPAAAADGLTFAPTIIDAGHSGDCKVLADLNGDGLDDAVVGGSVLNWYAAPDWTRRLIAVANSQFTTDMEAGDIDGDGDIDLVVPDGTEGVYWFENIGGGSAWTRRFIGATASQYCHDVEIGDIDLDGDLDVVGRPVNGNLHLFRREANGTWSAVARTTTGGEGLELADLDRDGRLDIVVNGQWHEAPDGNIVTATWPVRAYDASKLSLLAKVAAADLDRDGRVDLALTPAEGAGEIAWYAAPANPVTGTWTRHVLLASADRYHSLQLVDLDGDGWRELLTAQMHSASGGAPVVVAYRNPGSGGGAWERVVIAQAASHNLAVGDHDADGHLDLLGCDYIDYPPVTVWTNLGPGLSAQEQPARLSLRVAAAPNPFNARVDLTIAGSGPAAATLAIHDLDGSLVRVLRQGVPIDGEDTVAWDGRDRDGRRVPAGVYLAVVTAGHLHAARKIVLVP